MKQGDRPLIAHVFPSFGVGGAQVRFAAIANRYGQRWRHLIVSLDGDTACTERLAPDVSYTVMPFATGQEGQLPQRLWRIRRALRQMRPDVLVTANWGSIEWAMANLPPPRILHLHTEDGFGPEEAARQLPRRVATRRLVLRRSTVILPSQTLLRLAREQWRLPPSRLRHIPNGLDLARFSPRGPAAPLAEPEAGPLIGTVAALRKEKALDRLLGACQILAGEGLAFRLAIVGDGPERPALERLTAQLGLGSRVIFAGHIPEPADAYRSFDIFALSSSTEQMPFSVLEGMATGLPVASTNVGDVHAMIASDNLPFLAAALDEPSLAAVLRSLVTDPGLRARVGLANRRRAEAEFDQETMFGRYAELFDGERAVSG